MVKAFNWLQRSTVACGLVGILALSGVLGVEWWSWPSAGLPSTARLVAAGLTLTSVVALLLLLRQTFALERLRLVQQAAQRSLRQGLEVEVAQRTAQLTALAHHLQTAREDERSRLARDLHDELGALLTSAKLDAARIKSRLGATAPEAQERLAHLVETLNTVIALKRRITEDLHPSALSHLGLVATLEILAREFAQASGLEVHADLQPVQLGPAAELVAYRLVQEAITNITKHADARHVWISLASDGPRAVVSVRDDGVGFDTQAPARASQGLVGMRFRVEAEGGSLVLQSHPGQGSLVRISLPTEAAAAPVQI